MMTHLEHLTNAQLEELKSVLSKLPNSSNAKRAGLIERHGFDTKFAMHAVRLFLQCEQIMTEGDLDLERNSKILNGIRNGEWSLDKIIQWCDDKEKQLEQVYVNGNGLPYKPDEKAIKDLLLQCIEHHYGKVTLDLVKDISKDTMISEIENVLAKYK